MKARDGVWVTTRAEIARHWHEHHPPAELMRIAIVGAGAMGSVYAGLLGDAGNEVWAIDPWDEHVAAIREHGLRVEGASGDRVVRIGATSDPAEVGDGRPGRHRHQGDASPRRGARARGPLLGPETVVLTIQNGLGSPEVAAEVLEKSGSSSALPEASARPW